MYKLVVFTAFILTLTENSVSSHLQKLSKISGGVELEVLLIVYRNPSDLLANGKHCGLLYLGKPTCYLSFDFCVESAESGDPSDLKNCVGGWYSTEKSKEKIDSQFFASNRTFGTWKNPGKFLYNGWKASYLKARVWNTALFGNKQSIDTFVVQLDSDSININKSKDRLVEKGQRAISDKSTLTFGATMTCPFGLSADKKNCNPIVTTTTIPVSTTPKRSILEFDNTFCALGKMLSSKVDQMESNIGYVLKKSEVIPAKELTVSATFRYMETRHHDPVTCVSFTADGDGVPLSVAAVNKAFATFSRMELELILNNDIGAGRLLLLPRSAVVEQDKHWYKHYWWAILIVALALFVLMMTVIFLGIVVYRLVHRNRRSVRESSIYTLPTKHKFEIPEYPAFMQKRPPEYSAQPLPPKASLSSAEDYLDRQLNVAQFRGRPLKKRSTSEISDDLLF